MLCFDPSIPLWTNPQCFGAIPSPREQHSTTIKEGKAWLFGGSCPIQLRDLFELDMVSLTWTHIQINAIKHSEFFFIYAQAH